MLRSLAASVAADSSSGWPDTTRTSRGLPFSPAVTLTTTLPATLACLANGGYAGARRCATGFAPDGNEDGSNRSDARTEKSLPPSVVRVTTSRGFAPGAAAFSAGRNWTAAAA